MRSYRKWVLTLGIVAVTPGITLAGPFSLFKRQSSETKSTTNQNQQVAEKIATALRQADMSRFNIDIEYKRGTATLTGEISDLRQKARVSQIVARVPEVKKVDNRLNVLNKTAESNLKQQPVTRKTSPIVLTDGESPPGLSPGIQNSNYEIPVPVNRQPTAPKTRVSNQKMAEQIAMALGKSGFQGQNIEVRFINGIAMLSGEVDSPQRRLGASRIAGSVPGVQKIDNRLALREQQQAVSGIPGPTPSQLRGIQQIAYQADGASQPPIPPQNGAPPAGAMMGQPGIPAPPSYGHVGQSTSHMVYDMPHLPENAWPSYASYPNSSQVTYPTQYSASAWPYIGPFYPYPQVPMGWRQAQLEWDDGHWNLNFRPRTSKWWWFLNPENW